MSVDHTKCDITGVVERHIMIAVDTSDNARRAVLFVGDFFGCYEGFHPHERTTSSLCENLHASSS